MALAQVGNLVDPEVGRDDRDCGDEAGTPPFEALETLLVALEVLAEALFDLGYFFRHHVEPPLVSCVALQRPLDLSDVLGDGIESRLVLPGHEAAVLRVRFTHREGPTLPIRRREAA